MSTETKSPEKEAPPEPETPISDAATPNKKTPAPEYGGRKGPEATRFGDWEMNGKCVDF